MVPVAKAPIGTRLAGPVPASTIPGRRPTDRRSGHSGQSQHGSGRRTRTAPADPLRPLPRNSPDRRQSQTESGRDPERCPVILTVADHDTHVGDAAGLELGQHGEPELRGLPRGRPHPQAQHLLGAVAVDPDRQVHRPVGDHAVAECLSSLEAGAVSVGCRRAGVLTVTARSCGAAGRSGHGLGVGMAEGRAEPSGQHRADNRSGGLAEPVVSGVVRDEARQCDP